MKKIFLNQQGIAHVLPLLVIIAALGIMSFLLVSATLPLGDNLLGMLFKKPPSFAATDNIAVAIDTNANVHPISPYIYGTGANTSAYQKTMGATVTRWGGNQVTRYNWETEDANSGADWGLCLQPYLNRNYGAFSNVDYGPVSDSGFSIRNSTNLAKGMGMVQLFTVPNLGWVAKDGNNNTCSTGVPGSDGSPLGAQTNDEGAISGYDPAANRNTTSIKSQMKKGSAFVYPPNRTDGVVYQDELINWLVSQLGRADQNGIKFYAFDNEFDLWSGTHRDIHPAKTGYDALWNKFSVFSNAVKDIDPSAMTTGPVNWGWIAYWNSPLGDRASHGDLPLLKWFLRQSKQAETQSGRRILDVLDVHYYPQAGQYGNDVSANMQALRLRSTRELWDPTYSTESWQTCCEGGPQIQIIKRLKTWINEEYPGTKLGFTEWNWGADNHINGGLTIADILGIFGREDVYLANYWTTPGDNTPGYWAWRMYRNYDGNFSKFGDTSVGATSPAADIDKISVYASKDNSGKLKIMAINKQPANNEMTTFNLANFKIGGAQVYRYSQADTAKINQLPITVAAGSASFSYDLPAYSMTLFVLNPNTTSSPPPTPLPTFTPQPTAVPTPTLTPSPTPGCLKGALGDIDCDGDIDIFDFNSLVGNFGRTGANIPGDLEPDGDIDIFDFNTLVTNFAT